MKPKYSYNNKLRSYLKYSLERYSKEGKEGKTIGEMKGTGKEKKKGKGIRKG
jgi:hypothetical protein